MTETRPFSFRSIRTGACCSCNWSVGAWRWSLCDQHACLVLVWLEYVYSDLTNGEQPYVSFTWW